MKTKKDIVEMDIDLGDDASKPSDNGVVPYLKPLDMDDPKGSMSSGFKNFTEQVIDSNIPISKKINDLVTYKIALLQPLVQLLASENTFIDDSRIRYAKELYYLLGDLEKSIYNKTDFESKEEIDFRHPKITKSFEFMVEAVIESMQEAEIDDISINSFINIFSNKMVGFEDELDSRMQGVANAALSRVKNPLMDRYRELKNK